MPKVLLEGVDPATAFVRLGWDSILQRLFSTFPDGWPGFGLLLMRLAIGIALVWRGVAGLFIEIPAPIAVAQNVISAGSGIFLIAGLWTPVSGSVASLNQIWIAVSLLPSLHILLAVLSASAAMLGPGAWSIDARLFGRKRFYHDRTSGRKPSP